MRIFLLAVLLPGLAIAQTALEWVDAFGSNSSGDGALAIGADPAGNVYAGGKFAQTVDFDPGPGVLELTATVEDPFLVKLDPEGELIWARHLSGRGAITDLVVDGAGGVIVTGQFSRELTLDPTHVLTPANNSNDIFWARFDASGNVLWANALGGNGEDSPQALALDSAGGIVMTGTVRIDADFDPGPGSLVLTADVNSDSFVARYDSNGDLVWARMFYQRTASGIAQSDSALTLVLDPLDNVYVGGLYGGLMDFGNGIELDAGGVDAYLAFLNNTSGATQWVRSTANDGLRTEHFAMDRDSAGNLIVAGLYFGMADFDPDPVNEATGDSGGVLNAYLVSYDANGDFRWVRFLEGGATLIHDLTLIGDAAFTIAGQFSSTIDFDPGPDVEQRSAASFYDAFFAHYDSGGALLSVQHLESSGGFTTAGIAFAMDRVDGDALVLAGQFRNTVDFDPGPASADLTTLGAAAFVARYGQPVPLPEVVFVNGFELVTP